MTIQDRHLLIGSEIFLWLAGLNVLDVCFGILFEHYFDCYKRRCEQRYGEKSDDPSKKTNHSGLTFHFHRKFFLFVSDIDKRTNLADKPVRLSGKIFRLPSEIVFQTEALPRAGEKFLWPDGDSMWEFGILGVCHKATPQNTLDLEIVLGKPK